MDNRKKLHDYSIVMICFAVLNVFTFIGSVISTFVDGTIDKTLETVEPDIVGIVKITLIILPQKDRFSRIIYKNSRRVMPCGNNLLLLC